MLWLSLSIDHLAAMTVLAVMLAKAWLFRSFLPASACALPQKEAHIVTIHRDSCLWLYSNWQRDNGLIPTPPPKRYDNCTIQDQCLHPEIDGRKPLRN
ncbi:hypothetical protein Tco_1339702 [Tanacetum coccineum]